MCGLSCSGENVVGLGGDVGKERRGEEEMKRKGKNRKMMLDDSWVEMIVGMKIYLYHL